MAEQIDILTYAACWLGALLLVVILGGAIALISNWWRKRKNETR